MRHAIVGLAALSGCGGVVGLQPRAAPALADHARATPFALPSHTGARIELAAMLAQRDVVLVFYRGHW